MIQVLAGHPVDMITCYKEKAFAAQEVVTGALNAAVFFAHPHASWKTDTNFKALSNEPIRLIKIRQNSKHRKCIDID